MRNNFQGSRKLRVRAPKGDCFCGQQNGWTTTKTLRKEAVTCEKCLKLLSHGTLTEIPRLDIHMQPVGQLTLF